MPPLKDRRRHGSQFLSIPREIHEMRAMAPSCSNQTSASSSSPRNWLNFGLKKISLQRRTKLSQEGYEMVVDKVAEAFLMPSRGKLVYLQYLTSVTGSH
ncbi:hypothetical protein TNCV_4578281 [Trichonephila clavipes]|nr:hypothetical protein TNCV_4578281 [Trichonephila clavipes]